MKYWFEISATALPAIFLSAAGIYFTVILFTRLNGKRSFSSMSSFDFAMTVAVGSIIASTVLSSTVSLPEGIVGLASLFLLQALVAFIRRNPTLKKTIDNSPTLLIKDGVILEENLRSCRLTDGDLRSKLRAKGVRNMSQVDAVIFETTGDVSIILKDDREPLDAWLLKDVTK